MSDYKAMYLRLFNMVSNAIELLINAQQCAEEMFLMEADKEDEEKMQPPADRAGGVD